jgi:hypothetical protein
MLQVKNTTPLTSALAVFPDKTGVDTLYVVVRGTFALRPRLTVAEKPLPVALVDEYFADPAESSLKYGSELHIGKPGTDVVLVGRAWAPGGKPVEATTVMVSVAGRRKVIRVFGDRAWRSGGSFTRPEPFQSVPLVFERAFGGTHQLSDRGPILAEERNPVGVGFRGQRSKTEMVGQRLPNLEDPSRLIERLGDLQTPACFGFVAPGWLPRRTFAGTYDDAWSRKQAPYLPSDFDLRFLNVAAPELTFDRHLAGGEPVEGLGVSEHGPLRLDLPRCLPSVVVNIEGAKERPPLRLETVLLEPDANRVCLSWRASLPCDKKALKVKEVEVDVSGLDLAGASAT